MKEGVPYNLMQVTRPLKILLSLFESCLFPLVLIKWNFCFRYKDMVEDGTHISNLKISLIRNDIRVLIN